MMQIKLNKYNMFILVCFFIYYAQHDNVTCYTGWGTQFSKTMPSGLVVYTQIIHSQHELDGGNNFKITECTRRFFELYTLPFKIPLSFRLTLTIIVVLYSGSTSHTKDVKN
jgi:hypothetical protein